MSSEFMSQILKILFQTGDIKIVALCGIFLIDIFNIFNLKAPFLAKEHQR